MIKEIRKFIGKKNKWITVITEDERTIDSTLCHLQDQNPNDLYYVQDIKDTKERYTLYMNGCFENCINL